jgi:long-chain-fatty-acid--CoA ligase ACSBG
VWLTWTYNQYYEQIIRFAKSLIKIGLKPFETCSILGFNAPGILLVYYTPAFHSLIPPLSLSLSLSLASKSLTYHSEWFIADLGTIFAGGIACGIYISLLYCVVDRK